jgi:hypothetical protein
VRGEIRENYVTLILQRTVSQDREVHALGAGPRLLAKDQKLQKMPKTEMMVNSVRKDCGRASKNEVMEKR